MLRTRFRTAFSIQILVAFIIMGSAAMLWNFGARHACAAQVQQSAPKVWPSKPPAGCPFQKSTDITGLAFTGRHVRYANADTWYPSWAANGKMYSPWTDGKVGSVSSNSIGKKATTGYATILGDDPLHLEIIDAGVYPGDPTPYEGRYPCGSLVYNGVWYYGTYCLLDSDHDPGKGLNWDILGPLVGFRYSLDYGKTWHDTPHTPADPLFGEPAAPGRESKNGVPALCRLRKKHAVFSRRQSLPGWPRRHRSRPQPPARQSQLDYRGPDLYGPRQTQYSKYE